jgi:DNA-binding MarR family transcriptional regulator
MVDRLEDAGLVERRADPADRRAWRLHLTDRARPILDQLRDVSNEVTAEALAGIKDDEQAALAELLTRLRANLCKRGENDAAPLPTKMASNN